MVINRTEIRNALVQAYCTATNKAKPIDLDLVEAMVDAVAVALAREDYLRRARTSKDGLDDRHPSAS